MVEGSRNRTRWLTEDSCVLLFDIDGVLVTTLVSEVEPKMELLRLHPNLREVLHDRQITTGFITHRPRDEALRIFDVLGITPTHSQLLICANDLGYAALTSFRPLRLLRHGLLKSWALPLLRRRLGILPDQIAIIDDKPENLRDLRTAGCGLTMKSPSTEVVTTRNTICFDLVEAIDQFQSWSETRQLREITLGEHHRHLGDWSATGIESDLRNNHTLFWKARQIGKKAKTLLAHVYPEKKNG